MSIAPTIRSVADDLVARLSDDFRQHVDAAVRQITDAASIAEAARLNEVEELAATRQTEALEALRAELTAELTAGQDDALREAREALEVARQEAADAQAALEAAQASAQAVRAEADAALAQAETAIAEAVARAAAEVREAQASQAPVALLAASAPPAPDVRLQALARAISAMDDATTLSEVLDGLAAGLAVQAERSAVLVFKGDNARVWRRAGFDEAPAVPGDGLHVDDHADLKAIVEAGTPAYLEGRDDETTLMGVATLPAGAVGLAVPVAIGGQVAALAYADAGRDTDVSAQDGWGELVEVLARHAARCLEALTAMRASGYARPQRTAVVVPMPPHLRVVQRPVLDASVGEAIDQARRVARLLVSEIRLNREDDIRLGRDAGDLGDRLGGDIERARQQYLARVTEGVPGRDALFEDEVVRTLASGNAELLHRATGS